MKIKFFTKTFSKKDEKQSKLRSENNLALAAGVEDMEGAASADVASKTNWGNLADYLKIPRGVNDQGVNLLQKVYDQYDSDHNWRPEVPSGDAIGIERWAAAVRAAEAYIRKNYKEAGGNYFRKNADGSLGDDVSKIYGSPDNQPSNQFKEDDIEKARQDYFMFNLILGQHF